MLSPPPTGALTVGGCDSGRRLLPILRITGPSCFSAARVDGGVLVPAAGHTEPSVDISRLAGLDPWQV